MMRAVHVGVGLAMIAGAVGASIFARPQALLAGSLAAQAPHVWTLEELFRRNVGTREQQDTAFAPHRIIGNIYYVGTQSLASFLVATDQGHILINTDYERTVPVIKSSVEALGFTFTDIKVVLGSHAHGDHMQGDAMVKAMTGAQVMAMAEDVPALVAMTPGDKPHPIDRVLHDGDTVSLGGSILTAHLTPGHTRGCTTWTMRVEEGGRTYDVVIVGSVGVNAGYKLVNNPDVPGIAEEYQRSVRLLRDLPCDVPLASHPAMYGLAEKFPKVGNGPNPFIDRAGYIAELDLVEGVFRTELAKQRQEAGR